ncbi:MAG: DUF2442 domain-containing protein [Oscillospiraceae bacterium]|jgi:hypothetical protein|nr:DUF2442 domain-containing protein [Oscillospiraceae bacterium]
MAISLKRPRCVAVQARENYHLLVTFNNGEKRLYDAHWLLERPGHAELKNPAVFAEVKPAGYSIAWLHGQDVSPVELYDRSIPYTETEAQND